MSTFYLMPSRPELGEKFTGYLQALFPGLDWSSANWGELAELLGEAATRHPDVYVVFREELPESEDPAAALAEGFGAEPGDTVIEVGPGGSTARRWQLCLAPRAAEV